MERLTSKQRAHLRRLAHHLKPVVHIGSEGVSDAVADSVIDAFNTRELLKVKLQESAPGSVKETAGALSDRLEGVHAVQTIGRTIVLYREHPDDPEIELPRSSA